jgi:transcriptional regulator with XRE-family HTH domain
MISQSLLDRILNEDTAANDTPSAPPTALVAFFVRWVRGLHQWKQSTLAEFAGVSISTIERVERGEEVNDEALGRIAEALGYPRKYFTAPRRRLSTEEGAERLLETWGEIEPVSVAPLMTHRQIREAAQCGAFLMYRPGVPAEHDPSIDNLVEWLDLTSFCASTGDWPKNGKREIYEGALECVRGLQRDGLNVLSGIMHAPQKDIPD